MTIEEALEAYKEKFGGLDYALLHMSDEKAIETVRKCLETGKPIQYEFNDMVV